MIRQGPDVIGDGEDPRGKSPMVGEGHEARMERVEIKS